MSEERTDSEATGSVPRAAGAHLSDIALQAVIWRLERSAAQFGGGVLLAAYRAEAQRRGLKKEV